MLAGMIRSNRLELMAVRLLWVTLAPMTLWYLIVGLPRFFIYYELPCEDNFWPSCSVVQVGLQALGLDWGFLSWYNVVWMAAICIPFFILSCLLAWRNKEHPQTLLYGIALLVGLVMNVDYTLPIVVIKDYPAATAAVFVLAYCGKISGMVFYVFPDGRFVPGWTRWMVVVFMVLNLIGMYSALWPPPSLTWSIYLLRFILWIAFPLTIAYAMFYRYRKAANLEQRQQIKWIMWAAVLLCFMYTIDAITGVANIQFGWSSVPPTWYAVYQPFISPTIYYVLIVVAALSFYVAIFRYRLWYIDIFINRSLVYGALTVLLGSVLVGVFALTQTVLNTLVTDMQSGAAGIISMIVVIGLFLPVRDGLQRLVDSRLYGVDPDHERAVQAAIAQERDRLSRELHDSVTQSLYGLTIMAESCQRLARSDETRSLEEPLDEIGQVARQALKEMRLLIYELRPPVLAEEGLFSALHERLAAVERRSGIEASLVMDEVVDLPDTIEEACYYIAIEALNNVIKHSAATSVLLSFQTGDTWVKMEIADNGKGFEPGLVSNKGGMGMATMRKRTQELAGKLVVHSVPGQGTKITVRLFYSPVPRKRGAKAMS